MGQSDMSLAFASAGHVYPPPYPADREAAAGTGHADPTEGSGSWEGWWIDLGGEG